MISIDNLTRLINGEALNQPSVAGINGFAFEAKSVRQGYAYIGINADAADITQAVASGAYAVLSEDACEIIDNEIAFIKVSSLNTALMRLMRFESSHKNLKFCWVNPVQKAFLRRMGLEKNVQILPSDIKEIFLKIFNASSGDLFFCDDAKLLCKLSPAYDIARTDEAANIIDQGSIFFTTMIYDDVYYQNLNIPKVFAPFFAGLVKYLKANGVNFKIGDLKSGEHFEPIFVDRNFKITPFGASYRAFIVESDENLFEFEANFLRQNFSQMIEVCMPKSYESDAATFVFDELSELKNLPDFHYALVKCQKSELEEMLNFTSTERGLFD